MPVSGAQVEAAYRQLIDAGAYPTKEKIQGLTGGSYRDIQPHLVAIRARLMTGDAPPPAGDDAAGQAIVEDQQDAEALTETLACLRLFIGSLERLRPVASRGAHWLHRRRLAQRGFGPHLPMPERIMLSLGLATESGLQQFLHETRPLEKVARRVLTAVEREYQALHQEARGDDPRQPSPKFP